MSSKTEQTLFLQTFKGSLAICGKKPHKEHLLNITEITYASPQT
jgi:hypothetical protein